jgi:catechol 2,3-dioxygenase-like lactoylglutathione lyase family enzyme
MNDPDASSAAHLMSMPAVHSLHRFVSPSPTSTLPHPLFGFGLDARALGAHVDLHTFGHAHRWGSIYQQTRCEEAAVRELRRVPGGLRRIVARLQKLGVETTSPHPLADEEGTWFVDPEGTPVQLVVSRKVTPADKSAAARAEPAAPGAGAAPSRSKAGKVKPRRLSHILLFTSDVMRSVRFYSDALGLRLSDYSGDIIAFLHGAHSSDHHLIAFAKSDGPGLHHSSWDVATFDDVGLGMQQMIDRGHTEAGAWAATCSAPTISATSATRGAASPSIRTTSTSSRRRSTGRRRIIRRRIRSTSGAAGSRRFHRQSRKRGAARGR